ncbi:hypothetical protein [Litoreibacter albidus]|uniref:Uncharacterized protein n=1 Tax=Litoreibacter albidus TaxID=670155 RepID=A0A1H2ZIH0_9RHOB|nr:hypothetical protein [Litoreibacter albidus]SDX16564.1 hypothetical protein SAMN04488001_2574 [Litoreibacter albidus]
MIKAVAIAACVSTALAATSFMASALTLTEMSGSIDACHQPNANVDDTVAALAQEGWVQVPHGELGAEVTELLIWPQVAFYATGDTGGEQIKSIAELQRKTVAGFAKKKDIPQSKTRILTRQIGADTEAALVFWLQPDPAQTNIICRFALSGHSMIGHTAGDFGTPHPVETSPTQSYTITSMNAGRIAAKIGTPVTVSGIVQTTVNFAAQE